MKRVLNWLPVALGIVFLLLLGSYRQKEWRAAKNDFVTFYTGAKLAGTPDLYSRAANLESNKALVGSTMDMVYIRPPFYAALLKPLSVFPYLTAFALFSCVTLACTLWFVARFAKECSALPFLAAFSIPVLANFSEGQDASLLLLFIGGSLLLTRRGRDFAAGMLLSLCAIKFHLFLLLPVLFVLKKRWRIVGGGATGIALLTALGMVVNGPGSLIQWVKVLRDPWINPDAAGMPNLHGLVAVLHGDARLEALMVASVVAAFLWLTWKSADYELLLAATLVCGLLLSFHSMIGDDVLLFPVLILLVNSSTLVPLRALSALILTPVPYFLTLAGEPYSAVLPVAMLLMLVGILVTAYSAQTVPARPMAKDSVPVMP